MKLLFRFLLLSILISSPLFSQTNSVTGKISDKENRKPLPNAGIQLLGSDSTAKYSSMTKRTGDFEFSNVKPGNYNLKVTFIGYDTLNKQILVTRNGLDLGTLYMDQQDIIKSEIEVSAKSPIGEQKSDTTVLNSSGFKTLPDANAEDLVKKMPGIVVDPTSGGVKAQGEDVKKVLVDGKPFFGDDPTATLRNLPAEVIDKVQIYDKMSEQSEFTGFDDGQAQKTLNIITKKNKRNGQFGKFSGGGGIENKFIGTMNLNIFEGPQRISLLGLTNNINQQNFAVMDILDMVGNSSPQSQMFRSFIGRGGGALFQGGRGFGGGQGGPPGGGGGGFGGGANFFVGQQDGINTTHAFGVNYSDYWGEDIDVSGSYFYNYTNNDNQQNLDRNYISIGDTAMFYKQNSIGSTKSINHRFNFRMNYQLDSNTSIMLKPYMTVQATNTNKTSTGMNLLNTTNLNQSDYNSYSAYTGLNFSNELLFKHRLGVVGRTISVDINTGINDKNGNGTLKNLTTYNNGTGTNDTLDQHTSSPVKGYSLSGTISYTEPIHTDGQIMVSYSANFNNNNTDKRTFNYNDLVNNYDLLDSLLSNKFDNDYFYQRGSIAYRLKTSTLNITASADYQKADLSSIQDFPRSLNMKQSFVNVLPSLRFNYKFSKSDNLFINYRTSTSAPSITQLQNVIDNTNPMQISMGNPDLKQSYSHNMNIRYNWFSSDFNNVVFTFLSFNYRMNYISNSTFITRSDTSLSTNIILPAGGQLTKPVNLDGYWNLTGVLNYGFPLGFMSSKMNLTIGGNISRQPSLINGLLNYSNSYNANGMILLSSNISQNLDFNISSRINFNNTQNSVRTDQNYKYNSIMNNANVKWIFWLGIFMELELRNQIYTGITANNSDYTLLNISFGKKLFSGDNGELKLSFFDVLNQNRSNSVNVTDLYTEYSYSNVLTRYVLLTFTYNLRNFGK